MSYGTGRVVDPRHYEKLGQPVPAGKRHANASVLGTKKHTFLYEQGDPATHEAMLTGYARFRKPNTVKELEESFRHRAQEGENVWAFPSRRVAEEAVRFAGGAGRVEQISHGAAIAFVRDGKALWTNAGWIVSSRQAEDILLGRPPASNDAREPLREMVAGYYNTEPENIFFGPTGMAAMRLAHHLVTRRRGKKTLQLDHTYVDTQRVQELWGERELILSNIGTNYIQRLDARVARRDLAAMIFESTNNPQLITQPFPAVREIADRYDTPTVVDDTLTPPCDVDISRYADIGVTSLTKTFSGSGDVMGGCLRLNPRSRHYKEFKESLQECEELLYGADAAELLENGKHFFERAEICGRHAERIVDFLRPHPAIKHVYYPKGDANREEIRVPGGGYGSLYSVEFHREDDAIAFFDNIEIAKCPGLGNEFSNGCLIVPLTYFGELEQVRLQGLPWHLNRYSAGLEDAEHGGQDLIDRHRRALERIPSALGL